jgi:hypothetical protein
VWEHKQGDRLRDPRHLTAETGVGGTKDVFQSAPEDEVTLKSAKSAGRYCPVVGSRNEISLTPAQ